MLKCLVNFAAAAACFVAAPALAQVETIDPNQAAPYPPASAPATDPYAEPAADPYAEPATDVGTTSSDWAPVEPPAGAVPAEGEAPPAGTEATTTSTQAAAAAPTETVPREDVFTAAEDVFGRGAEGLAGLLENILRDQGEPTAYISGQEAGGAFVFGVRYGSGTMHHQIEGDRAVYWTGPSLGFDFGADANKVFVLVYNLHDSQGLFKRFAGAEGHAYFVGGFTAQYLRRGDVVLIPIRLGVGLRLGVNAGYMRFTERNRWVPF
jgi:hypothetical protein